MPIHDWTRVDAGIFHAFHHDWITDISRALNRGLLPSDYYALPEQIAGGLGPDVLTLRFTPLLWWGKEQAEPAARPEPNQYASKAKAVVVRHASDHRVIAVIEIVSPGNKNNRHGLRVFVAKAVEMLQAGVHLLIVDLFPPSSRDPQGIHQVLWEELMGESDFTLPADARLTLAAYIGGDCLEAFVEPRAVGAPLIEMPLFLTPEVYVPTPLEATYRSAWDGLPAFWRGVLAPPAAS
jgi:hypothetical protein